jgi:hypothetical protein
VPAVVADFPGAFRIDFLFGPYFFVILPPSPAPPADDTAWRAMAEAFLVRLQHAAGCTDEP